jgi:integrase
LKTASAARDLVAVVKAILDEDAEQLEPFLTARHNGRDNKAAREEMRPVVRTWTLQQCTDAMLEARTKSTASKPLRPASVEEIRRTLARPEMAKLINEPVATMKRGDLESARDKIEEASGISASKKLVSNVRTILSYCCEYKSGDSGLDHRDMWWELLKSDKKSNSRTRKPNLKGLVKTLALAERYLHEPLPGRTDGKKGVRANTYAGLWWLTLTVQRTEAGLSLRKVDFYEDPNDADFYLAAWDDDIMKSGKTHVLPIPRRAVELMRPLMAPAQARGYEQSVWAFPSEASSKDHDIHLGRTAIRQFLVRLDGRDSHAKDKFEEATEAARKSGSKCAVEAPRSLLQENGIAFWSPHDLRRTITDVMDEAGIPAGASAVLAHEIELTDHLGEAALNEAQREEWLANRMAKITKLAYGGGMFLKCWFPRGTEPVFPPRSEPPLSMVF